MGATVTNEGELRIVRLTGKLRKSELDAIQWGEEAKRLAAGARIKVLVIAGGFEGWYRNDKWSDVSFVAKYGGQIEKIALVAEPQWEAQLLMFTGAGFRRSAVRFFPTDQLEEARAWLSE